MKAVTLYQNHPAGIPDGWPATLRDIVSADELRLGETLMTDEEYAEHVAGLYEAKEAWNQAQEANRPKVWTCLDFIARFTPDERAAVRTYAPDLMEMLLAAHEIESDNPLTIYGLSALVAAGIITEARKGELLS